MSENNGSPKKNHAVRSYLLLIIFITILVIILWAGLRLYGSNLRDFGFLVAGRLELSNSALIIFAALAGIGSFFSPCAFPLLPAYASYYISIEEDSLEKRDKIKRALYLGSVATLGLMILYTSIGIGVGLSGVAIGSTMFVSFTFLIMGIVIMILGWSLLMNYSFNLNILNRFWSKRFSGNKSGDNTNKKFFLYGVGYGLAAMGCTLPILLTMIIYSWVIGGLLTTFAVFLVYSISMGLMMVIVTVLVALSKDVLLNRLKASTRHIKTVSGVILLLIGVYMIYYFLINI